MVSRRRWEATLATPSLLFEGCSCSNRRMTAWIFAARSQASSRGLLAAGMCTLGGSAPRELVSSLPPRLAPSPHFAPLCFAFRPPPCLLPCTFGPAAPPPPHLPRRRLRCLPRGRRRLARRYTCERKDPATAIGGHFLLPGQTATTDPWLLSDYSANAEGHAYITFNATGFSLYDGPASAVTGRALVVHLAPPNQDTRSGCGVIGNALTATPATALGTARVETALAYATITMYPGVPTNSLGGTLALEFVPGADLLRVRGFISGLGANERGGWHIHEGFSCAAAGNHYFASNGVDDWLAATYVANGDGVAEISATFPGYSLTGEGLPVLGHALVVHSGSARVGCGVITPAYGAASAHIGRYPQSGGDGPAGVLFASNGRNRFSGAAEVQLWGVVSGLAKSATGGWHVHVGTTCAEASAVGKHYYEGLATDPWDSIQWTSDDRGVAQIALTVVSGFTLSSTRPIAGRAIVFHAPGGARVGCGLLGAQDGLPAAALTRLSTASAAAAAAPSGEGIVGTIEAFVSSQRADFVDLGIVWMKTANPVSCPPAPPTVLGCHVRARARVLAWLRLCVRGCGRFVRGCGRVCVRGCPRTRASYRSRTRTNAATRASPIPTRFAPSLRPARPPPAPAPLVAVPGGLCYAAARHCVHRLPLPWNPDGPRHWLHVDLCL